MKKHYLKQYSLHNKNFKVQIFLKPDYGFFLFRNQNSVIIFTFSLITCIFIFKFCYNLIYFKSNNLTTLTNRKISKLKWVELNTISRFLLFFCSIIFLIFAKPVSSFATERLSNKTVPSAEIRRSESTAHTARVASLVRSTTENMQTILRRGTENIQDITENMSYLGVTAANNLRQRPLSENLVSATREVAARTQNVIITIGYSISDAARLANSAMYNSLFSWKPQVSLSKALSSKATSMSSFDFAIKDQNLGETLSTKEMGVDQDVLERFIKLTLAGHPYAWQNFTDVVKPEYSPAEAYPTKAEMAEPAPPFKLSKNVKASSTECLEKLRLIAKFLLQDKYFLESLSDGPNDPVRQVIKMMQSHGIVTDKQYFDILSRLEHLSIMNCRGELEEAHAVPNFSNGWELTDPKGQSSYTPKEFALMKNANKTVFMSYRAHFLQHLMRLSELGCRGDFAPMGKWMSQLKGFCSMYLVPKVIQPELELTLKETGVSIGGLDGLYTYQENEIMEPLEISPAHVHGIITCNARMNKPLENYDIQEACKQADIDIENGHYNPLTAGAWDRKGLRSINCQKSQVPFFKHSNKPLIPATTSLAFDNAVKQTNHIIALKNPAINVYSPDGFTCQMLMTGMTIDGNPQVFFPANLTDEAMKYATVLGPSKGFHACMQRNKEGNIGPYMGEYDLLTHNNTNLVIATTKPLAEDIIKRGQEIGYEGKLELAPIKERSRWAPIGSPAEYVDWARLVANNNLKYEIQYTMQTFNIQNVLNARGFVESMTGNKFL